MIINPSYIIQSPVMAIQISDDLPWALPQLQNNAVIVILIIAFAAINLLACHPNGMLMQQLAWLGDTRNARTFEASSIVYPWLKPVLVFQLFLFTCLSIYCITDSSPALHLGNPDLETWIHLGQCLLLPVIVVLLQFISYNWFCYLFNTKFQQIIMNRTYMASLIVLSPLATLIFIGTMSGSFSHETTVILLATLFILSQILFIFNGIKIFLRGIDSFLIIIAYLCTLEFAPLWLIWARLTT